LAPYCDFLGGKASLMRKRSAGLAFPLTSPEIRFRYSSPRQVPIRAGFGTRLIERSLAQELDGHARIAFAPSGVVYTVDAPLA